jgi:hypothetical protein
MGVQTEVVEDFGPAEAVPEHRTAVAVANKMKDTLRRTMGHHLVEE